MTDIDNLSDEEAVETIQGLIEEKEQLHRSLAVHWLAGTDGLDRDEAEQLIDKYANMDEDEFTNPIITEIKDEYKDLAESGGGSDDTDADTTDLEALDGIAEGKAQALRDAGVESVQDILNTSKDELKAIDGISDATVERAKKDATRYVDPIEVTAANAADREREALNRVVEHNAMDIQISPGKPTGSHFHGLPVLEDPDEVEDSHPFVPEMGHDYYPSEVKGMSIGFGAGAANSQAMFSTDKTDVEVACKILADNDFCLNLRGDTGTGKNMLLKYIASQTNRPVVRVNFGEGMTYEDLVGEYTLETDDEGNQILRWVDGFLTMAVRYGWIFIADEMNAAPAECTMPLHAVTEEDPELTLKKKGEVIKPHPSFRFAATMNPPQPGRFQGTNKMNEAFKTRFYTIDIDYLPEDQEVALLKEKVNADRHIIDKEDIRGMVQAANRLRNLAREGDNLPTASTRELIKAAKLSDIMDAKTAFQTVLHGMMEPEHDQESINETVHAYL